MEITCDFLTVISDLPFNIEQVRGTRSENGKIARENMMSIMDTCRKMNVIFFNYVKDIFSRERKMTKLSELIVKKASQNSPHY